SQWVTGPLARRAVHRLRSECDAVVVGGNTVRCDNPQLITHGQSQHNPKRIVLSRQLDLPRQAHLWNTQVAPTLVFTTPQASPEQVEFLTQAGVEVIITQELTPKTVTHHLFDQGCAQVLWECGGHLAAQAIKDGIIDKVWAFVAPKLLGGFRAPGPVDDLGIDLMTQAIPLNRLNFHAMGEDFLIEGYLTSES
ncbi:MAG TPA: dihydrofolate reductase family protein, partial [Leptolyngbyaceae cyanobacterium M65_K2018_010]|nr:dihydrofolate reductase family protein [Leptolyngbyaceae cyanobacterium M65_K2018_010]